jgi:hypothetical protein
MTAPTGGPTAAGGGDAAYRGYAYDEAAYDLSPAYDSPAYDDESVEYGPGDSPATYDEDAAEGRPGEVVPAPYKAPARYAPVGEYEDDEVVVAPPPALRAALDGPVRGPDYDPGRDAAGYVDLGGNPRGKRRRYPAAAARDARRAAKDAEAAERAERAAVRRAKSEMRRGVRPPRVLGPFRGQTFHRLRLPAHMETTAQIAGIYPFVVDAGLDAPGMFIGRHVWSGNSFTFDVFELYRQQVIENPNFAVFGAVGSRKSSLLKTLISRGSAFGYQAAVPCDPKGEYTRLARRLGCEPVYIGPGLSTRLNPLDAPPRPRGIHDHDWAREVKRARSSLLASLIETAKGLPLTPPEHTAIDLALDVVSRQITGATTDRWATPLLPQVLDAMTEPSEADCAALPMTAVELRDASRDATLTLRRLTGGALSGLFDGPTTSPLDFDRPIAVLNLERVQGSDEMIALIMTCAQGWMEAALMRQDGVQRYVVYDECWRLMRFAGLVRRLSAQQKLARQWGCANAIVAHRISDLLSASPDSVEIAKGLLAETSTRILYKQSIDQVASTQQALGLTDVAADLLPRLDPGFGLWLIGQRSFYVEHVVGDLEIPVVLNGSKMHGEIDDTNLFPEDLDPDELDPPGMSPEDFAGHPWVPATPGDEDGDDPFDVSVYRDDEEPDGTGVRVPPGYPGF